VQDLQASTWTTTEEQDMSEHVEVQRMPLDTFEGHPVEGTVMKIAGKTPILDDDVKVTVDDKILLIVELNVVGIRHYTDPATGKLIREQMLKPMKAARGRWDPEDPNDDGVLRHGAIKS
jgi:hypothetical protein